jgi:hypothetical protein
MRRKNLMLGDEAQRLAWCFAFRQQRDRSQIVGLSFQGLANRRIDL